MDKKFKTPVVRDILNTNIIAFKPDFTFLDAINGLNKYKISSAPVVNDRNEVIGYFSEADCMKSLCNCLFFDEVRDQRIDLVMSKMKDFAEAEWDIFKLENFFVTNHLSSAPVVDSDNQLIGIVSRKDTMVALEKCIVEIMEYKKEIKAPVIFNMQERIRIINDRVDIGRPLQ